VAFRHSNAFCVAWLLIVGATLEMCLGDLVGIQLYQPIIAMVKAAEIILAALCMLRYGAYADVFNPGLAFVAMFAFGAVHGLHPALSPMDSLRSLIGSVVPFAFAFSRLSPGWSKGIVRATICIPILSVTAGGVLALMGLRPLFIESGGERLAGLGHPAFLASFCLAAIYACLILLGVNFVILLLTGARAPMAYAVVVTGLTLVFVHSDAFPRRCRVLPILLAACLVPLVLVLAGYLTDVRLFNLLGSEAANLSGRELLWPPFQQAAAASPWLGWGVGAGNAIIPPDSQLALTIQSWAAHNEYLRMLVEGGQIGRGLLIVLFVCWVARHTRVLCRTDRAIMRLVFLAFAAHAYTANVLISTTACVFFAFVTAVFARGRLMNTAEVA
jgi:O-antigen ligase